MITKIVSISISLLLIMSASSIGCGKRVTKGVDADMETVKTSFRVESPAYRNGQRIPEKYCNVGVSGGKNISVPVQWYSAPEGTKSMALIMVDRHPIANNWIHWLVINIPPGTTPIPESASGTGNMPAGSLELNNTFGRTGYGGPQPPPGTGDHDYEISLYALNSEKLNLTRSSNLSDFLREIEGKVLASAKLSGLFAR